MADLPPTSGPVLLDVGSGGAGVAAFLRGVPVVGVDIEPPEETVANLTFKQGSIMQLPFADGSFPLVSCIDVLENLPLAARDKAIAELVRVASHGVLIACPQGEVAERCDLAFRRALDDRGKAVPAWILEHQAHPYPAASAVIEAIRRADSDADVSLSYSEPAVVCRIVRAAAARSSALYAAANLVFGVLLRVIPEPDASTGYRMVVYARRG